MEKQLANPFSFDITEELYVDKTIDSIKAMQQDRNVIELEIAKMMYDFNRKYPDFDYSLSPIMVDDFYRKKFKAFNMELNVVIL